MLTPACAQWHSVSVEEFERKHELLRDAFKAERLQVRGHQMHHTVSDTNT
jgi:hypothetical protein